jgi:formylglycine-generating enzyme required for sulfatase activity
VDWFDAQDYVAWLNRMTGTNSYRLLSEAEWEYAARGVTSAQAPHPDYPWGNEIGRGNANCNDCGSRWDFKQTAPVGSFKHNAFGLYEMVGNVYQWVEDCYHENYRELSDGSAWTRGRPGWIDARSERRRMQRFPESPILRLRNTLGLPEDDCNVRMVRGGSWNDRPEFLRPASRFSLIREFRSYDMGFRVGRTLLPP